MSRPKGSKNYGAVKPWDEYGLTEAAYRYRLRNGIPLDAVVKRGRKKSALALEHESKLDAIREKYRNGVSREMIEDWIMNM